MAVAKMLAEIEIPGAHSLKDRRQVVRSLKDKLLHMFNLSVAEMDDGRVWNRATLGMVAISSSRGYLQGQMEELDRALYRLCNDLGAVLTDSFVEMLDD